MERAPVEAAGVHPQSQNKIRVTRSDIKSRQTNFNLGLVEWFWTRPVQKLNWQNPMSWDWGEAELLMFILLIFFIQSVLQSCLFLGDTFCFSWKRPAGTARVWEAPLNPATMEVFLCHWIVNMNIQPWISASKWYFIHHNILFLKIRHVKTNSVLENSLLKNSLLKDSLLKNAVPTSR